MLFKMKWFMLPTCSIVEKVTTRIIPTQRSRQAKKVIVRKLDAKVVIGGRELKGMKGGIFVG